MKRYRYKATYNIGLILVLSGFFRLLSKGSIEEFK
jgi:hypothetical protein